MSQNTNTKVDDLDMVVYFGTRDNLHYVIDKREWCMVNFLRNTKDCDYEEAFNRLFPRFEESIETTRDEPFIGDRIPRGLYLLLTLGERGTDAMIRKVLSLGVNTDASTVSFLLAPEYFGLAMERVMQVKKRMFIKGAKREEE